MRNKRGSGYGNKFRNSDHSERLKGRLSPLLPQPNQSLAESLPRKPHPVTDLNIGNIDLLKGTARKAICRQGNETWVVAPCPPLP